MEKFMDDDLAFLEHMEFNSVSSNNRTQKARKKKTPQGNNNGLNENSGIKESRRYWTEKEEKWLVSALLELQGTVFHAENGYKSGYMLELEKKAIRAMPGTTIRANPHIDSKIKTWRRMHGTALGMLRTSGFGWNDEDKTVVIPSEDVYLDYLKVDKNAALVKGKPLIYMDEWNLIFGKDRATGENVEGPADAATNPITIDDQPVEVQESIGNSKRTDGGSNRSKKRKRSNDDDESLSAITKSFGEFIQTCDKKMDRLADRVGYDYDLSATRRTIYAELEKLELTSADCLCALQMILNVEARLDAFLSIPEHLRLQWVQLLLKGDIV